MYSWDTQKAILNYEKHGVSFEEATTVFDDPEGLEWEDLKHSHFEGRKMKTTKKRSGSSARAKRIAKSVKHMPDSEIDFSDIPESTEEELKRGRRVGRPSTGNAKMLIAIRIDPRLLAKLRKLAEKQDKPYQTLIHELLEKAAKKAA